MTIAKQFNHDFSKGDFKLFDENGNLVYFEDSEGYWAKREYDQNGNEVYYENSEGEIEDNRPKPCEDKVVEIDGVKYKLSPL